MNCCVVCSTPTRKQCGKCQVIYFCSRTCQLKQWPIHKERCRSRACAWEHEPHTKNVKLYGHVTGRVYHQPVTSESIHDIRSRLCNECVNDDYAGQPVFSRMSHTHALPLDYWNMWYEAGANMCWKDENKRSLLEKTIANLFSMYGTVSFAELETFQNLVDFFLLHHPPIVLMARLPIRLPGDHVQRISSKIILFDQSVSCAVEDVLLVTALVAIVMEYAMTYPTFDSPHGLPVMS